MSKLLVLVCAFASVVALTAANSNDCVFKCVFGFGGQAQRFRRSVFASVASNGNVLASGALNTSATCAFIAKSVDCVKNAPGTKLTSYADVFGKTISEHCGDHFDERKHIIRLGAGS
ncbi:hypothetical protein AAVH_17657 [Aphelenchoides avenae]|nr:hypothetical protein AAVH_17657 [Aphelenchus avenae]